MYSWQREREKPVYSKRHEFEDQLGQVVEVGDVIAYAVDQYGTPALKIAEVTEIMYRENGTYWEKGIRVKVAAPGRMGSMLSSPRRIVLVTKSKVRLNG